MKKLEESCLPYPDRMSPA